MVPRRAEEAPAQPGVPRPDQVRIVEAAPVRHERPPTGRGPVARLKRATWKPPPTAEEELAIAIESVVAELQRNGGSRDLIALDAPAAVILSGMNARRIRLAPGSLRWLADRWDAKRAGRP